MRRLALALVCSTTLAAVAPAATTNFLDTFDGEGGSGTNSIAFYDAFANFEIASGFVILWRGAEATECVGGTGACIGFSSRNGTTINSRDTFAVSSGQRVTLEWDAIRHNAASGVSFNFLSAIGLRDTFSGGAFGGGPGGDFPVALGFGGGLGLGNDLAYKSYSLAFTAVGDTEFKIGFFGTTGLTLDNVKLTIAGVPEPASWAMMIAGFGLVGAAMRRQKVQTRFKLA